MNHRKSVQIECLHYKKENYQSKIIVIVILKMSFYIFFFFFASVLKLYDEALKLETSLFAVPIDLKQLWPKYEKTINKQMLQQ